MAKARNNGRKINPILHFRRKSNRSYYNGTKKTDKKSLGKNKLQISTHKTIQAADFRTLLESFLAHQRLYKTSFLFFGLLGLSRDGQMQNTN